jgi:hypothetical protein
MKVKGKVYLVDKPALTFDVMDPYGSTLGTVTVKNPKSLRAIIDGKEVGASELCADEDLTLWVPESTFSAQPTATSQ